MNLQRGSTTTEQTTAHADSLDWQDVDTVLFDMDGTILDLHFDNYFWEEYVPELYGQRHGLATIEASALLRSRYEGVKGTLQWYCTDFWSDNLAMDIPRLKEDIRHRIAIRPTALEFVQQLRKSGRQVMLVTNAHPHSLALKMRHTGIGSHFHHTISSHTFHLAKENDGFWQALRQAHDYEPGRTLLIDDSLAVLRQAQREGIRHLRAIRQPDSRRSALPASEFVQLDDFSALMQHLGQNKGTDR